MTVAEMSAQDAAVIIAAAGALVVTIFGVLLKVLNELRVTATETNRAVNSVPAGSPTTRVLVEELHSDLRDLRRVSDRRHEVTTERHRENVERLKRLDARLVDVESDLKSHMSELDGRNEGDK